MKKVIPAMLCLGALLTSVSAGAVDCYPKYNGPYTDSIVDALKYMKVDSSYTHRSQIASANGIANFRGTSAQNLNMLDKLCQGTLAKETVAAAPKETVGCYKPYPGSTNSIVDALKAMGVNATYQHRARIAKANGIADYKGTATQNLTMLQWLKAGTLKAVD